MRQSCCAFQTADIDVLPVTNFTADYRILPMTNFTADYRILPVTSFTADYRILPVINFTADYRILPVTSFTADYRICTCCPLSSVNGGNHCHLLFSPWYNRTGWLGLKHQVTYYLCFSRSSLSFSSSRGNSHFVSTLCTWSTGWWADIHNPEVRQCLPGREETEAGVSLRHHATVLFPARLFQLCASAMLRGAVRWHPVGGSGREADVAEWGGSVTSCWRETCMQASKQADNMSVHVCCFSFSLSHHLCCLPLCRSSRHPYPRPHPRSIPHHNPMPDVHRWWC